jgi:hypothetical protein
VSKHWSGLPIKDRIELLSPRKLRDGLEKVVGMIHERTIREVLNKLLAGLDPLEGYHSRVNR